MSFLSNKAESGGGGTVSQIDTFGSIVGGPITTTGTLQLDGDSATPGNRQYYGTNASGIKGFYDLSYANFEQIAGLSVLGVAGNLTAVAAAITAGIDNQVLRRLGSTIGFGTVNLNSGFAVSGTLFVAGGGTGVNSALWAQGDLVYLSGVGTWDHLAKSTSATRYLSNQGTDNNPSWNQVNLANGVTGSLPFANLTQGSARSVLGVTGNATADVASIQGTANQVLVINSAGTALSFGAVNLASSAAVTGDLPFANLTQGSARSVLGVTGNATADVASIQGTADQVLVVNGAGTALAFGTVATGGITNDAVTFAKMQNITTARLLGRNTAGTGDIEEITAVQGRGILALETTSTDNAIVRFNGTSGSTQNSLATLDDLGSISATTFIAGNMTYGDGSIQTSLSLNVEVGAGNTIQFQASSGEALVGIGGAPTYNLDLGASTGAVKFPVGNTAARPSPTDGLMRFNSETTFFEIYANGSWQALGAFGSYTPTFSNVANTTGNNAFTTFWYRVGNRINVFGKVQIALNTSATLTQLSMTPPITPGSSFSGTEQAGGSCISLESGGNVLGVRANSGGTDIIIEGVCGVANLETWSFHLSYDVS